MKQNIIDNKKLSDIWGLKYDTSILDDFGGLSRDTTPFLSLKKWSKEKITKIMISKHAKDEKWLLRKYSEEKGWIDGNYKKEQSLNWIFHDVALMDEQYKNFLFLSTREILTEINEVEINVKRAWGVLNNMEVDAKNNIYYYWKSLSSSENCFNNWYAKRIRTILYQESGDDSNEKIDDFFRNTDKFEHFRNFIKMAIDQIINKNFAGHFIDTSNGDLLSEKIDKEDKKDTTVTSLSVREIIKTLNAGELNIPNFQRDYVWNVNMIADLYNSISQNYPIGNILVSTGVNFNTKNLVFEKVIETNKTPNNKYLVLDGQQRLTSIAMLLLSYLIKNGLKSEVDNIEVSLIRKIIGKIEKLIFYEDSNDNNVILCKSENLRKFCEENPNAKILKISKSSDFKRITEKILDYKIPLVVVPFDDTKIVEIFRRINTKGTTLSSISLLHSAFGAFEKKFELTTKIANMRKNLIKDFEISEELIVQAWKLISEYKENRYNNDFIYDASVRSIFDYFKNDRKNASEINNFINSTDQVEILLNINIKILLDFGFSNEKMLPSIAFFLAPLALLLRKYDFTKNDIYENYVITDNHKKELGDVFKEITINSINKEYSSSTITKVNKDINNILKSSELKNEIEKERLEAFIKSASYINKDAIYKLIIAQLCSLKPLSLLDGAEVNANLKKGEVVKKDQHHFAPKNWKANPLKDSEDDYDNVNLIKNICIIDPKENREVIKNNSLKNYLLPDVTDEELIKKVEESHCFEVGDFKKIKEANDNELKEVLTNIINKRIENIAKLFYKKWGFTNFL